MQIFLIEKIFLAHNIGTSLCVISVRIATPTRQQLILRDKLEQSLSVLVSLIVMLVQIQSTVVHRVPTVV